MGVKESLKNNGLSDEVIESIVSEMNKENSMKSVPKEQYNKISKELAESRGSVADLEAKITNLNTDEFKVKYEELEKTHNDFVSNIETEKVNSSKSSTLKSKLIEMNANKEAVDLLLTQFDLSKIELEDGNIKDWDNVVNPIKEKHPSFFGVQSIEGNSPMTPPGVGNGGSSYTREQIQGMTTEQINANWGEISKSLAN